MHGPDAEARAELDRVLPVIPPTVSRWSDTLRRNAVRRAATTVADLDMAQTDPRVLPDYAHTVTAADRHVRAADGTRSVHLGHARVINDPHIGQPEPEGADTNPWMGR